MFCYRRTVSNSFVVALFDLKQWACIKAVGIKECVFKATTICATQPTMRRTALVLLLVFLLVDVSESWRRRRRRRRCVPKNCVLKPWSYGSCSRSCGGGVKLATRAIKSAPQCNGKPCPSDSSRERRITMRCNVHCCPVHCQWNWLPWGPCSGCGMSIQSRPRRVTQMPSCGGFPCPLTHAPTRPCNTGL